MLYIHPLYPLVQFKFQKYMSKLPQNSKFNTKLLNKLGILKKYIKLITAA